MINPLTLFLCQEKHSELHQKHHGKSVLKGAHIFHRIWTLSTVRPVVTKELVQTECQNECQNELPQTMNVKMNLYKLWTSKELVQTMNVKRTCTNNEHLKKKSVQTMNIRKTTRVQTMNVKRTCTNYERQKNLYKLCTSKWNLLFHVSAILSLEMICAIVWNTKTHGPSDWKETKTTNVDQLQATADTSPLPCFHCPNSPTVCP